MKTFLYRMCQCTWGCIQTLIGGVMFLIYRKNRHYSYHGAIVTEWERQDSVSLGMFLFVAKDPSYARRYRNKKVRRKMTDRLLVHEYGHTVQSLMLGPLYPFVISIPSALWGYLPVCVKRRRRKKILYFSFFTERWADALGEWVTGHPAMRDIF